MITATVRKQTNNKATILLESDEITAGIFEVDVYLDRDVINPKLSYTLISSGSQLNIPLEGDGTEWHGLFKIDESTEKQ